LIRIGCFRHVMNCARLKTVGSCRLNDYGLNSFCRRRTNVRHCGRSPCARRKIFFHRCGTWSSKISSPGFRLTSGSMRIGSMTMSSFSSCRCFSSHHAMSFHHSIWTQKIFCHRSKTMHCCQKNGYPLIAHCVSHRLMLSMHPQSFRSYSTLHFQRSWSRRRRHSHLEWASAHHLRHQPSLRDSRLSSLSAGRVVREVHRRRRDPLPLHHRRRCRRHRHLRRLPLRRHHQRLQRCPKGDRYGLRL
jgi:hypothetical protein